MIPVKSAREIACMRDAGKITGEAIAAAARAIEPGITTKAIDAIIRKSIEDRGATPSFLGYRGYPASSCISVNDVVIHGIPGDYKLVEGDIVSLDVGAFYKGFHGDSGATYGVGRISAEAQQLIDVTKQCFYQALAVCHEQSRVSDISRAVATYAALHGYGVVEAFTGHGVGAELHEEPEVPNFVSDRRGPRLVKGMTLAIEPMILMGGRPDIRVLKDGWTVVSKDGSLTAYYEHTVLITDGKPELLTAREDDAPLPPIAVAPKGVLT